MRGCPSPSKGEGSNEGRFLKKSLPRFSVLFSVIKQKPAALRCTWCASQDRRWSAPEGREERGNRGLVESGEVEDVVDRDDQRADGEHHDRDLKPLRLMPRIHEELHRFTLLG